MLSFQYGTTTIDYSIEYKKDKKDVSLSVSLYEGVIVAAPEGFELDKIKSILHKKAPWILKKKYELEEVVDSPSPKEFVSGEKFPYLGRHYRLKVNKAQHLKKSLLTYKQGRFIAEIPINISVIEKRNELTLLFKDWYSTQGYKKIEERLKIYCSKMEVVPSKVVVKEQPKRWGTCTREGSIYLNWRILMAPMAIIDYVLVHELAHLKYPDHSTDFWRFLRSILPDYEQRKEWLRVNGPSLTI
jgi:predicted metal-dependent hydrolase